MFSLICIWINGWVNNREAGDLRSYRAHYDVIVMLLLHHKRVIVSEIIDNSTACSPAYQVQANNKIIKTPHYSPLCEENSTVTSGFPIKQESNDMKNSSVPWRHDVTSTQHQARPLAGCMASSHFLNQWWLLIIHTQGRDFNENSNKLTDFRWRNCIAIFPPYCPGGDVLTQWGWNKMAAISQTAFSSAFLWMKNVELWINFHWNMFLMV